MNILMLTLGIAFIILGIVSLFKKRSMVPKSNPRRAYQIHLRISYFFVPIMIGIIVIALATE